MLNPALAIFSMVASCKLPLGKPNRNFLFNFLLIFQFSEIFLGARAGILFLRLFHARHRIDLPFAAGKATFFFFTFTGKVLKGLFFESLFHNIIIFVGNKRPFYFIKPSFFDFFIADELDAFGLQCRFISGLHNTFASACRCLDIFGKPILTDAAAIDSGLQRRGRPARRRREGQALYRDEHGRAADRGARSGEKVRAQAGQLLSNAPSAARPGLPGRAS